MDYTDKLDLTQERDAKRARLLRDAIIIAVTSGKLSGLQAALDADDALFEASLALSKIE